MKGLTKKDIDKYLDRIIDSDKEFAIKLQTLQEKNFPKKLDNIHDWCKAEEIKRKILGLSDKTSTEHSGNFNINVVPVPKEWIPEKKKKNELFNFNR